MESAILCFLLHLFICIPRNRLISEPKPLDEMESPSAERLHTGGTVHGTIREAADTFEKNEIVWRDMEVVYYSAAPAERVSSSA